MRGPSSRSVAVALVVALASVVLGACDPDDLPATTDDVEDLEITLPEEGPDPEIDPGDRPDAAEPERDEIDDDGPVGGMGSAILSGGVPSAEVEVDTSPGVRLTDTAREALAGELADRGGKDTRLTGGDELPSREVWSTAAIQDTAAGHRDGRSTLDRVALHVLVLDGRHENDSVLGVALNASTLAVFPEAMGGGLLASIAFDRATLEEAVVVHELGHLFGLVNLTGQGAFHEDPEHPGHSASRSSVMHWAVETDAVAQVFEGGPPTEFDEADEREMARIRST